MFICLYIRTFLRSSVGLFGWLVCVCVYEMHIVGLPYRHSEDEGCKCNKILVNNKWNKNQLEESKKKKKRTGTMLVQLKRWYKYTYVFAHSHVRGSIWTVQTINTIYTIYTYLKFKIIIHFESVDFVFLLVDLFVVRLCFFCASSSYSFRFSVLLCVAIAFQFYTYGKGLIWFFFSLWNVGKSWCFFIVSNSQSSLVQQTSVHAFSVASFLVLQNKK